MAKAKKRDPKSAALAQDGVLNPVQVRYEMVRRHQVDGLAISEAAAAFGVTRPTFYKAQNALQAGGLAGLLPGRRGPRVRIPAIAITCSDASRSGIPIDREIQLASIVLFHLPSEIRRHSPCQ